MEDSDNRYTRAHIDKTILDPTDSNLLKYFKRLVVVPILDFWPVYALFIWADLYLIINFDFVFFLLGSWILAILSIYWLYIIFVKYYLIKVCHYQIRIKNLKKPVKFVFFSDIHIGKQYYGTNKLRLQRIIKKINNLNCDVVVCGGDFICEKVESEMLLELKNINAANKIAVYGNHDGDYLHEEKVNKHPEEFLKAIQKSGFKILINEGKLINIDGQDLYFAGIPDLYSRQFNVNKAFEGAPKGVPKILLSHNPDIIDFIEDKDEIDLILSGHNHSGMIYFKPFGALLPMPTKYRWLTQGIFKIGNRTKLLLSQGIGYSTTRLRIGTESEICIVELI